jgi:hypothetical protein
LLGEHSVAAAWRGCGGGVLVAGVGAQPVQLVAVGVGLVLGALGAGAQIVPLAMAFATASAGCKLPNDAAGLLAAVQATAG